MAINFREACFGRRVSSRSEWRHDVYYAVFCLVLSTPSNEFFSWSRPWGSSAIFYNAAAGFLTLFSAIFHKNVLVKDLAAFFAYLAVAVAEVCWCCWSITQQLLPAGRSSRKIFQAGWSSLTPANGKIVENREMAAENFLWELWKPLSSGENQPDHLCKHSMLSKEKTQQFSLFTFHKLKWAPAPAAPA